MLFFTDEKFYLYIKIDTQITSREFEIDSTIAEAEVIAISIIVSIYTVYLQEDKIFTSIYFNNTWSSEKSQNKIQEKSSKIEW